MNILVTGAIVSEVRAVELPVSCQDFGFSGVREETLMPRVWSQPVHPSNRLIGCIQSELEMAMEVRQLQIFRTLAEELNFTRTAEKVHTVQSNVTAQIKALEEELGVPLFDRLGRRVTLTDAGRNFLPFAEQALAAMEQGQRAVQTGAEPSGPLRIGAPESVLTYRLPQVLRAFRRRFPHVELIFRPYSDATLALKLEVGKFDMAIHMADSLLSPALRSMRLRTER